MEEYVFFLSTKPTTFVLVSWIRLGPFYATLAGDTSHRCSHRTVSMPDGMPAGQQGTFRTPIVGIGAAKPASRTSPCGLRPRPIPGISWRTPAKVSRPTCHEETMVANKGNQTGSFLDSGRP